MLLDIILGAWLAWSFLSGRQLGVTAQVARAVAFGVGLAATWAATPSVAEYVVGATSWSHRYAFGLTFTLLFIAAITIAVMITASTVHKAWKEGHPGGMAAMLGGVFGVVVASILSWGLLGGFIVISQHMGGKSTDWAIDFAASRVASQVLLHNGADPEPYPHGEFLRYALGARDFKWDSAHPEAGKGVVQLPDGKFLSEDAAIVRAILAKRWDLIRPDMRVATLVCNDRFLSKARAWMTPKKKGD